MELLNKLLEIEEINTPTEDEITSFFDYDKLTNYLNVKSYDPEEDLFRLKDGATAFSFLVATKPSVGKQTFVFLQNIFQDTIFPPQGIVQATLWGSDFLHPLINAYLAQKSRDDEKSYQIAQTFMDFINQKSNQPIYDDWRILIREAYLFISFIFPQKTSKSDVIHFRDFVESTLTQSDFSPTRLDANTYLLFARLITNPNSPLEVLRFPYKEDEPINEQIVEHDTILEQKKGTFKLNNTHYKVMTVKEYPKKFTVADTREWVGSIMHLNRNQINSKFIISFILQKLTEGEKSKIAAKSETVIKQQSFSVLSTKLQDRKDDAILFGRETEGGQQLWKGLLSFILYHNNESFLTDSARTVKNYIKTMNVTMQEEINPLPFFVSALPLNPSTAIMQNSIMRAKTMFSYNAVHTFPIQFDWKGSGTPTIPLVSRSGQLAFIDLWDTNGGMNACVLGPMGQGKSVFVNHMIFNYRSLPDTKIRVIDVGRSYIGTAKLFEGEFVEPTFENPIKINPFSNIKNIDRDMNFLINIVDTMIKPREKCSDTERGMIQNAIRNAYKKYGKDTDINSVKAEIDIIASKNHDYEFKKLAEHNLSLWCTGGQYSAFMKGKSELDLSNRLIVFELGAIKDDEKLINVIILTLFYFINSEIYQGDRNLKKVVIWDEAWRFAKNQAVLGFIEQGAREYRKYNGSLVFITQGVSDLMMNDVTKTLKNNSEYLFVFWQPAEEWERIAKDKDIYITEYEKNIYRDTIKTVKGKYSEILVMSRNFGRGILRLVLPPEIYWIYTTDAKEVALRSKFYEETGDIIKAVHKCIEYVREINTN